MTNLISIPGFEAQHLSHTLINGRILPGSKACVLHHWVLYQRGYETSVGEGSVDFSHFKVSPSKQPNSKKE